MSEDILQIDYDQMATIVDQFQGQADAIEQMSRMLNRHYAEIKGGGWEGAAADAFFSEYETELEPALNRLYTVLEDGGTLANQIIQVLGGAEEEAAAQFTFEGDIAAIGHGQEELATASATTGGAFSWFDDWQNRRKATRAIANIDELQKAIDKLEGQIALSTPPTQEQIDQLSDLIKKLAAERKVYLDALVELETFEAGNTSHLSPSEADKAIQQALGKYVEDAVNNGRQIAGTAAVVGDEAWNQAGINRYGEEVWKQKNLAGFVDKEDRVWIHKDNGNTGTMVHEGVHIYSDDAILDLSQPLNEGVTEYFTRSVVSTLDPPVTRTNYANNYAFTERLATLVGEDTLADAYFNGNDDALKQKFMSETNRSEADWNAMINHTKDGNWLDAGRLATRLPGGETGPR